MIFSSEQPQTGMNEGTWFTQGMCIKNEGIFCREEKPGALGVEGDKKKASVAESLFLNCRIIISSRTPQ